MEQGDVEKVARYREEADLMEYEAADKRAEAERLGHKIEKLNSCLRDARAQKEEIAQRKAVEKARLQELKKELQATLVEARNKSSAVQQRRQEHVERHTRLLKKVQARVTLADRAFRGITAVKEAFEHHANNCQKDLDSADNTYHAEIEAAQAVMEKVDAMLRRKLELQSMLSWDVADADYLITAKIDGIKAKIQKMPATAT